MGSRPGRLVVLVAFIVISSTVVNWTIRHNNGYVGLPRDAYTEPSLKELIEQRELERDEIEGMLDSPTNRVVEISAEGIREVFTVKCVAIIDGVTIECLKDGERFEVRFARIECPGRGQQFGDKAMNLTGELCLGKELTIYKTGIDENGRTLAFITTNDEMQINNPIIRLIENGLAWNSKDSPADPELAKLEAEAREAKTGLWANSTQAIEPR